MSVGRACRSIHLARTLSSRNFIYILLYLICVLSVFCGGSLVINLCHVSSHLGVVFMFCCNCCARLKKNRGRTNTRQLSGAKGRPNGRMAGYVQAEVPWLELRERAEEGTTGHTARGHRENWPWERVSVPTDTPSIHLTRAMCLI